MLSKPSAVAKRLGVSRVAVYRAIRAGRFAAVRVFGGTGPVRVFTDAKGDPLRVPPVAAGKTELVEADFLARRLRVTPTLVRRACSAGVIDAVVLPGGTQWRVVVDCGTWLPLPPRELTNAGLQNAREVASRASRRVRK